jgi:hypothetical protein
MVTARRTHALASSARLLALNYKSISSFGHRHCLQTTEAEQAPRTCPMRLGSTPPCTVDLIPRLAPRHDRVRAAQRRPLARVPAHQSQGVPSSRSSSAARKHASKVFVMCADVAAAVSALHLLTHPKIEAGTCTANTIPWDRPCCMQLTSHVMQIKSRETWVWELLELSCLPG